MAHGLETRVPLWSQELVSWASRIPIEAKIKNGELKSLLKEVALPLVPEAVINGPKRGFPTPLRLWFRDELFGFARERLLRPSRLHEIVSPAKVERLLDSHRRMPLPFALDERRAHRIWILLCLESWIRQFDVKIGAEHG